MMLLHVNLTSRTQSALDAVVARSGDSPTDTINRALQVYEYLDRLWRGGGEVLIKTDPAAELQPLRIY